MSMIKTFNCLLPAMSMKETLELGNEKQKFTTELKNLERMQFVNNFESEKVFAILLKC